MMPRAFTTSPESRIPESSARRSDLRLLVRLSRSSCAVARLLDPLYPSRPSFARRGKGVPCLPVSTDVEQESYPEPPIAEVVSYSRGM